MLCHRSLPIHCYVRCGLLDFFCWITYPRCFAHIAAHCCILVGMYRKHPVLLRCLLFFLDMAINTLALHSYILFCQFIAKCFWDQKATLPVYHVVIGSCRMRGSHYVTWKEALTQSSCILMNLIPKSNREREREKGLCLNASDFRGRRMRGARGERDDPDGLGRRIWVIETERSEWFI